jgi:nucleotide-binding universal stress UspA family protein
LTSRLRNTGAEVRAEVLLADSPADEIVRYARQMKPTFIAMVGRARHGITERFSGGIAARVLQAEVAPVLIVPR